MKLTTVALCSLLFFSACKKNDTTANSTITGTWTLSELGTDVNSNNVLDAGETFTAASVGVSGKLQLNSDNTFSITATYGSNTDTQTGTYTYANNTIISTYSGGQDTAVVQSVTANKLVVLQNPNSDKQWEVFVK